MTIQPLIHPLILGTGHSGRALAKSLGIIRVIDPGLDFAEPRFLERGQPIEGALAGVSLPLLIIANPHGLHCENLLAADRAGCRHVVVEKPACVTPEELERLKSIRASVAVCHVYRQMWGPQTLKQMIQSGELGEVFTVEGRYWQSSAARRAVEAGPRAPSWKNDTKLSGPYDVLLDVASHWADAAFFLMGETPQSSKGSLFYANAEAPHRDTHVQLSFEFSGSQRAWASVSKTMHGATNHFELNVLGSKRSATWLFEKPDELSVGQGGDLRVIRRASNTLGTEQASFHGAGWLEGYVEILHQVLLEMSGKAARPVPTLSEHLAVVKSLFQLGKI